MNNAIQPPTPEQLLCNQVMEKKKFDLNNNVKGEIQVVQSAGLRILIHNVMLKLCKNFPGYDWLVSADDKSGMIDIYLPEMGGNYAYSLHIAKLDTNKINTAKNKYRIILILL